MKVSIKLPEELEEMAPELKTYWEAMVKKLYDNRHKSSVNEFDVPYLMGRLLQECGEYLEGYHVDLRDKNNLYELADIGNFALLIHMAMKDEIHAIDKNDS